MLVLSRKRSEIICLGNDIRVTLLKIRGDKVWLGIEAPVVVPVHRGEVYTRIHEADTNEEEADEQ